MRQLATALCLTLFAGNSLQAEEWLTLSLSQLSCSAEKVVEVRFLSKSGNDYLFLADDLLEDGERWDTLFIQKFGEHFYRSAAGQFERCHSAILYLERWDTTLPYQAVLSGYRLLVDNEIHYPVQPTNPGPFELWKIPYDLSWDELKRRAIATQRRVQPIAQLRQMEAGSARNQLLLQFLQAQAHALWDESCAFDADCGWGDLVFHIFDWIAESEIAADVWQASRFYYQVYSRISGMGATMSSGAHSFKIEAEIEFLMAKALDTAAPVSERRQALVFLDDCCRYPESGEEKVAWQTLKYRLAARLQPLLSDTTLHRYTLQYIANLPPPASREQLDFLIPIFKQAPPSYPRSTLGKIIAQNASEAEWKALTGCERNIAMQLEYVGVEFGNRMNLIISSKFLHGTDSIFSAPLAYLRPVERPDEVTVLTVSNLHLPWFASEYGRNRLKVLDFDLPPGRWLIHLEGRAGRRNEYYWRTDPLLFSRVK